MPAVAHLPSHHHHRSPAAFFSSIGTILHVRSHNTTSSPPSSCDDFESNLAERLSSLAPLEGIPCISLASLAPAMSAVLSTEEDLRTLLCPGGHHHAGASPAAPPHVSMVEDFLDHSVKLLDACNAISERIAEVDSWIARLQKVLQILGERRTGSLNKSKFLRAKQLLELHGLLEIKEGARGTGHVPLHFTCRIRHSLGHYNGGDTSVEPRKWRSWHSNRSSSPVPHPAKQLHVLASMLSAPKMSVGDCDERLAAAIYGLDVVSVFFLGTIVSSFPNSSGKSSFINISSIPRTFKWATPFLDLQERVQEEARRNFRTGKNGYAWEIEQVFGAVQRLSDFIEAILFADGFPSAVSEHEEVRNLVKQLQQYAEDIDKELRPMQDHVSALYRRLVDGRMGVLDLLSSGGGGLVSCNI